MAHPLSSEHALCQEKDAASPYTQNPEPLSTYISISSSFPCLSNSSDFDKKYYAEGFSGHSSCSSSNQLARSRSGWHLSDLNSEAHFFAFDGNSNDSVSLFSLDNPINVVNHLAANSQVLPRNSSHAEPTSSEYMCTSMDNGVWQQMTNPAVSYTSNTLGSVLLSSTEPLVDVESARNREMLDCAIIKELLGRSGNNNSINIVSPLCLEPCVITRAQLPINTHSLNWNQLDGFKNTHLTTGLLNIDHSIRVANLEDSSCLARFYSEPGLSQRVEKFAFPSSCDQSMCSGGGAHFHLTSEALQCQDLPCFKKVTQASCPLPQTSPEAGSNVKATIDHPTCENANMVGNVHDIVVDIDENNKRCRSKCTSLQASDETTRVHDAFTPDYSSDAGPKIASPGINEVVFSPEKKRQRQFSEDTRPDIPSLSQTISEHKAESEGANSTMHEFLKGSIESGQKKPKVDKSSSENSGNASPISTKGNVKPPEPPPKLDYIHVRARRGQATDSHSLAERVRREKISERMKFLQDLVPGCSKVTGKALMLDEIINYVQSLQSQVEL
ncbi:hypothetical protein O6H91_10G015300 [Diphasiastrum complanatum]|uniref:Uncharacterized protein n=1 Tax=Diphasiastrum complanatum TaxID=34168 RepID=A0ACC2CEL1_DIPCM|nr:hypothetical protein O6H91_10G015300 [Diphasiastrum complanatum]